MSNIVITEAGKLAKRFQIDASPAEIVETLKATAFKGQVTDAQMAALMLVSAQYGLNPWTKEVYAFPDKNNGIVPVVGVDGWARIINEHPQFDGMEFEQDNEYCTCIIYRKDRSHPIKVTEYMAECKRTTGPWQSHPRRMLRHKAMIQCARLAFGFAGIYDADEAERIVEAIDTETGEITRKPASAAYPADRFESNIQKWRALVESGSKTPDDIIAMLQSKASLTPEQIASIRDLAVTDVTPIDVVEAA